MQVPSNMILSKISYPSWYIAAAMLIWGMIVSSCSQRRAPVTDPAHISRSLSSLVSAATLPMSSSRGSSSDSSSELPNSRFLEHSRKNADKPVSSFSEPSSCPEPCSC